MIPHCTGKVGYDTFSAAMKQTLGIAKRIRKGGNKSRIVKKMVYRCPDCHQFHIGRTEK